MGASASFSRRSSSQGGAPLARSRWPTARRSANRSLAAAMPPGRWGRTASMPWTFSAVRRATACRILLPIRHQRMAESPFSFYRGAAVIMADDLAHTPTTGVRVQACGDAHLANFGIFASPERRLVFDINDFDETLPAPWEWDVKRFATSVEICGRHLASPRRGVSRRSDRRPGATVRRWRDSPRWATSTFGMPTSTSRRSCASVPTTSTRQRGARCWPPQRRRPRGRAAERWQGSPKPLAASCA